MNLYEQFTDRAQGVLILADLACRDMGHAEVGTEHLLIGVAEETGTAHHVLRAMGVTPDNARRTAIEMFGAGLGVSQGELQLAPEAYAALEAALRESIGFAHEQVGTEHLLLGLLRASTSRAVAVLTHLRVDPDSVRERILDLIGTPGFVSPEATIQSTRPSPVRSTGSGPGWSGGRVDGVDVRELADEVARLRKELYELRAIVQRLDRTQTGPTP